MKSLLVATMLVWASIHAGATNLVAQNTRRLTLAQAEALALRNHPRLAAAVARADASHALVTQARSAYFPTVAASLTGMGADRGTAVAAGNLTTSSLANRTASGFTVSQLVMDFGRTASLIRSSELQAGAQSEAVASTRASLLLRVRQAYFRHLLARALLRVAEETVDARRLTLRQISALARSELKSTLDVTFAEVNVSEAELALFRAQSDIRASAAELSGALGYETEQSFELVDDSDIIPLGADVESFVAQALAARPDLQSLRLQRDAASKFAEGERSLRFPSLSILGSAGVLPIHEDRLRGKYAAAGLNLSIPVFNGNLFAAREAEATLKARAAGQDVKDLEIRIAQSVRVTWLNALNSFRRLDVTARLLDQATRSLTLAQSRYNLGLSSIVELTQAQLAKTSGEIAANSARYDYQTQRAALDYETGALK
jgi:outer membrane protein